MSNRKLEEPILKRVKEGASHQDSIPKFEQSLYAGRAFVESARTNITADVGKGLTPRYTTTEIDEVATELQEIEDWFTKIRAAQDKLKPHEDYVLKTSDMEQKGRSLQDRCMKLLRRRVKIKLPKANATEEAVKKASKNATEKASAEEDKASETQGDSNPEASTEAEDVDVGHDEADL